MLIQSFFCFCVGRVCCFASFAVSFEKKMPLSMFNCPFCPENTFIQSLKYAGKPGNCGFDVLICSQHFKCKMFSREFCPSLALQPDSSVFVKTGPLYGIYHEFCLDMLKKELDNPLSFYTPKDDRDGNGGGGNITPTAAMSNPTSEARIPALTFERQRPTTTNTTPRQSQYYNSWTKSSSEYNSWRNIGRGEEERRGQPLCRRDITWLWDIRNTSPTLVAAAREIDSDDRFIKGSQKEERMIPRRFRSQYALNELNKEPLGGDSAPNTPSTNDPSEITLRPQGTIPLRFRSDYALKELNGPMDHVLMEHTTSISTA